MGRKIVVAVTGASGSIYAKRFLEKLKSSSTPIENCSLVFSKNAMDIWEYELKERFDVNSMPFNVFDSHDFYAPFASGSAGYDTMVIIPCSTGTLGRIATGVSDDLITRAADVILKERGRLIVVPREAPYNLIHLRNMVTLTEAGAIVMPATPSFYSLPANIDELVDTVVNRVLDLAGIENTGFQWGDFGTQRFAE
ncbi:MAG: UbiX family flavin prenyltransferase [Prolixibacteraceae bacterium]|jgi:4-hydroxy-3-polyprenylbenzoate decarboxylase|nr:UbiX family flavin prenyltransferase [Prolixibacteraceae bacterium]